MENKDKELDRLNGVYGRILKNAGVEFIEGRGRIIDAHTVDVDGKRYTVRAYWGCGMSGCWLLAPRGAGAALPATPAVGDLWLDLVPFSMGVLEVAEVGAAVGWGGWGGGGGGGEVEIRVWVHFMPEHH